VFDTTEEALNQVAPLVEMAIKGSHLSAVHTRGDHRLCTALGEGVDQDLCVIGSLSNHRLGVNALEQCLGLGHIGRLSGGETPTAQTLDQSLDLRCRTTAWAANGLCTCFFKGARALLVHPNDGAVDEDFLVRRIARQMGEDPLPHPAFLPPGKALIDPVPGAKRLWQIAPGGARRRYPQQCLDEQAMVRPTSSAVAPFAATRAAIRSH
jgi:hypothetical protein